MSNRNVAVFIDAENLFKGYGKLDIPDISMEEILEQLETAAAREAGAGTIALSRGYADWNAIGLEDYRRDVVRAGVDTVQVFSVGKAEKNAADIVLVVDCLRVAAELPQLEVFILVSADGDFVPLVRRLHELDKYVIGATLSGHKPNSVLAAEVDQYVELKIRPSLPPSGLQPVFSADPNAKPARPTHRAPSTRNAPSVERVPERAADKPAAQPPRKSAKKAQKQSEKQPERQVEKQPEKKADKQPRTPDATAARRASGKANWHEMAKDIEVVHAGPASSPDEYKAIIKQVLSDSKVRSFCDKLANQGGTLPILAMAIKAAAPQLSPSDARVSSLSRALRFALADTQYALARESDDVQPVLVRRNQDPAGMLSDLSLDDIQRGVQ